jgi:hypothetical protein
MKHHLIIFALMLGLLGAPAFAQENPTEPIEPPPPSSGVRFSIGGSLQAEFGSTFKGQLTPPTSSRFTLKLSGEVGNPDSPTATFLVNMRSSINATGQTQVVLREALVNFSVASFDFTAGNQLISWGATDAFNPLNVINPQNLTNPLDVEGMPVLAIRVIYNLDDRSKLEGVLVPGFRGSELPPLDGGFTPPAGVTVVGINPVQVNTPASDLASMQGGLRFGTSFDWLEGADLNVSYWSGWRTTPTASALSTPAAPGQIQITPLLNYDRINLIGLDFTTAYQGFVVRLETAYTITQDMDGTNPTVGNPSWQTTLQGEYSFIRGLNTILAVDFKWTRGDVSQNDNYTVQSALLAAYEVDNRTQLEAAWIQNYTDGSGLLTAKVAYTLADGLSLYGAGGFFYGGTGSSFGALSAYSQVRFGLRFSF